MIESYGRWAVIWLDERLDRPGRNAVLAHELIHDDRGVPPVDTPQRLREKEEALVRAETARRLVPLALLAAGCDDEPLELWQIAEHFDVPKSIAWAAIRQLTAR